MKWLQNINENFDNNGIVDWHNRIRPSSGLSCSFPFCDFLDDVKLALKCIALIKYNEKEKIAKEMSDSDYVHSVKSTGRWKRYFSIMVYLKIFT